MRDSTNMRVGLQGWGSEGDLRPLIALAARIRKSGHEARLVLTPVDGKDYRPLCESLDVALKVVPERMAVTLQQLVRDAKSADPTKLSMAVLDLTFSPHIEAMYAASLELCASSDVVVGGSSSWQLKAASLKAKVPFVALDFLPGIVPSRVVPPASFPHGAGSLDPRGRFWASCSTGRFARLLGSSSPRRASRPFATPSPT